MKRERAAVQGGDSAAVKKVIIVGNPNVGKIVDTPGAYSLFPVTEL